MNNYMKKTIISILKAIGLYKVYTEYKFKQLEKKNQKEDEKHFQPRLEFYSNIVSKGQLVYDVGANVGNRVNVLLAIGARVVAVEPQKNCIETLHKKFGDRIDVVGMGLGAEESEKDLYIADYSTISSMAEDWIESVKQSRFKQHNWEKKEKVKITTLDKLIEKFGLPQFCKIDVEGYEVEVLKGLHQPIPVISFEYTVPEQNQKLAECLRLCQSLSPDYLFNYSVGEGMVYELDNFIPFDSFIQHVATDGFIKTGFGDIYVKLSR